MRQCFFSLGIDSFGEGIAALHSRNLRKKRVYLYASPPPWHACVVNPSYSGTNYSAVTLLRPVSCAWTKKNKGFCDAYRPSIILYTARAYGTAVLLLVSECRACGRTAPYLDALNTSSLRQKGLLCGFRQFFIFFPSEASKGLYYNSRIKSVVEVCMYSQQGAVRKTSYTSPAPPPFPPTYILYEYRLGWRELATVL